MIHYELGDRVVAFSTCKGEERSLKGVITPEHQAHSTNVACIPEDQAHTYGVDALITDQRGITIGVRTADCVPVLLYDARRHAAAAIHSGWKGTLHNITAKTIERMQECYGSNPEDIRAVIGPCIHIDAFEVGEEVYTEFHAKGYARFAKRMRMPDIAKEINPSKTTTDFECLPEGMKGSETEKVEENVTGGVDESMFEGEEKSVTRGVDENMSEGEEKSEKEGIEKNATENERCTTEEKNMVVTEKWHIDLPGICESQLKEKKVKDIYISPLCTYYNHNNLYSYRYTKSTNPTHRIITTIQLK